MSFDFPNSPTNGQVFAPASGPVYVYTGGVWRMQGSGQVVTAEARNRIVNGAMQISQEWGYTGTANVASLAFYAADQWSCLSSLTTSGLVNALRVASVTPNGSRDRIRINVGTAKAALVAGDYVIFQQSIEGIRIADFRWGTASAKQVVLRFGFKGPAGTYTAAVVNGAAAFRSYLVNFTISAAQANVDTEQLFVIPGDTIGTWATDNTRGMYLSISVAGGTTYQGVAGWQAGNFFATSATSNGMATAGNQFELFDVGLYLDPNATGVPPPWQMPDEAQELAACQRYYEMVSTQAFIWSGYVNATSSYAATYAFKVNKRINPAMTALSGTQANMTGQIGFNGYQTHLYAYMTGGATSAYGYFTAGFAANARM